MDQIEHSIGSIAQGFHSFFSQNIWPKNPQAVTIQIDGNTLTPCYHNQHHIIGVLGATKIATSRFLEDSVDPFGINEDLTTWNHKQSTSLSLSEFAKALYLAFAMHDLGNLTKSDELKIIDEQLSLDYSDHFQLEIGPCEERSARIAKNLLQHFDTDQVLSTSIKQLIEHLILQTIFVPTQTSSDHPFWLLMQFIDQVGSYFFSNVPLHQASAGYLNEIYVSSETSARVPFSLKQFLSFFPDRFYQMVSDLGDREKFLSLFDPDKKQRDLFDYYTEVPDRPIQYTSDVEEIFRGKWNKVS